MTEKELEELITDHPFLYHMAEDESWPTIRDHGLMSTSAILDFVELHGEQRIEIESNRRPETIQLRATNNISFAVRDQKPMTDSALRRCLADDLSPSDWYEILNRRTFFWLTKKRLNTLLCAGSYSESRHDVLVVDTRSLIQVHRDAITLSPMNSGNTRPYPHPRSLQTFLPISEYPYAHRKSRRLEVVVELAVEYCVPDIQQHVVRVHSTACNDKWTTVWER